MEKENKLNYDEVNNAYETFIKTKVDYLNLVKDYIDNVLTKYDNKIYFTDDDFNDIYDEIGGICVSFDGGNHPEYETNLFSKIYGIYKENGSIYIDCEECSDYGIDRVFALEELFDIAYVLNVYDKYMSKKVL